MSMKLATKPVEVGGTSGHRGVSQASIPDRSWAGLDVARRGVRGM
jgi:hypothetical protein